MYFGKYYLQQRSYYPGTAKTSKAREEDVPFECRLEDWPRADNLPRGGEQGPGLGAGEARLPAS